MQKFEATVDRDRMVQEQLKESGWNVLTVWECEIRRRVNISKLLSTVLEIDIEQET